MTAPTPLTVTRLVRLTADTWASRNDGTAGGDAMRLTIVVQFAPDTFTATVDYASEQATRWVAQYLDGRDLTASLDFAPTLDRLAVYLFRVFEQFASQVESVEVADGGRGTAVVRRAHSAG